MDHACSFSAPPLSSSQSGELGRQPPLSRLHLFIQPSPICSGTPRPVEPPVSYVSNDPPTAYFIVVQILNVMVQSPTAPLGSSLHRRKRSNWSVPPSIDVKYFVVRQ